MYSRYIEIGKEYACYQLSQQQIPERVIVLSKDSAVDEFGDGIIEVGFLESGGDEISAKGQVPSETLTDTWEEWLSQKERKAMLLRNIHRVANRIKTRLSSEGIGGTVSVNKKGDMCIILDYTNTCALLSVLSEQSRKESG